MCALCSAVCWQKYPAREQRCPSELRNEVGIIQFRPDEKSKIVVILSRGILGIASLVACALGTHPALAQVRLATAGERTDERCLADNIYFEAAHEPLDGKLAVAR